MFLLFATLPGVECAPRRTRTFSPRHVGAFVAVALLAPLAAACGSSSPAKSSTAHGTASVACAGSLDKLYHTTIGPAFEKATGDHFGGPPCAGSTALASEITSGEIHPGVFLSVGAKAIKKLWPTGRSKFAIVLATDPLVVAYSPKSHYASQLNAIRSGAVPLSHLFQLFETSGFKLGRTDPTQDPQGIFFILMVKLATAELNLPASTPTNALGITATSPTGTKSQILSEDALPTDIATGIVDAGSEYLSEALQYHLDYITLPADLSFAIPADNAKYASVSIPVAGVTTPGGLITLNATTVTPGKGATFTKADSAADEVFIAYLLSSSGRQVLAKSGYTLETPVLKVAASSDTPQSVLPSSVLKAFTALHGTVSTS